MKLTRNHKLFDTFLNLACRLSPENLHCDGEISQREAHSRYLQIKREWKLAERAFGAPVTEDEIYSAYNA